jgi:hypothetical protein
MGMMAVDIAIYDAFRNYCANGTIDLDSDVLRVMLLTSAYSPAPGAADWIAANVYTKGTIIKLTTDNLMYYEAVIGGVSSGTRPLFPTTRGATVTENTVTWKCWGYAPPSGHTVLADVSSCEIVGTGYSAGGATVTGQALTYAGRSSHFTAEPTKWPGALFTCRYAVLYKSGTANGKVNPLIAYMLLDSTGTDIVLPGMTTFTLSWDVAGILNFI